MVCVTDKSAEMRNREGIDRVADFGVEMLQGWGS